MSQWKIHCRRGKRCYFFSMLGNFILLVIHDTSALRTYFWHFHFALYIRPKLDTPPELSLIVYHSFLRHLSSYMLWRKILRWLMALSKSIPYGTSFVKGPTARKQLYNDQTRCHHALSTSTEDMDISRFPFPNDYVGVPPHVCSISWVWTFLNYQRYILSWLQTRLTYSWFPG